MQRMKKLTAILAGATGLMASLPAVAQDFPAQPVKIVVPYAAGGGVDALARALADRLSQAWRKPVVVENKPGASTIIGAQMVKNAAPDGHTLLFTTDSTITSNPYLFKSLPYDPIKDFAPITQLIDLHMMVVVHPSISAGTLAELVALAKARPKVLNYGSFGNGSQAHLLFEMLKKKTGVEIEQIPFKGTSPAVASVLSGETHMTLSGAAVVAGHIKTEKLKALAVSAKARMAAQPSVPTLAEAGYPEIDPRAWFGLFATGRTPAAVTDKIQKAVAAVLAEPEFRTRYVDSVGNRAVGQPSAEFARFITADLAYKKTLIDAAGIKPE